jgi:DNA-binding NarL/FixJ family response regulator
MKAELKRKSAPSRKKVYVVEDHPIFRQGLMQILGSQKYLTVCGAAGTVEQALPAIARTKPDLVLVDISLPGKSGLELIKEIRSVDRAVKLLVISMHDEAIYAARVLRAGGDGYIMKQEDPDEILQAITDVLEGHIYVSEEVMENTREGGGRSRRAEEQSRPLDQLTDSELEVLELLGRGKRSHDIARELRLSERSVMTTRSQIREKLKLKNARALFRYAVCWVESEGG